MVRRADRFGRWETISYLGGGGNGVVWKVRDTSSGDLGAIKILTSPGRYRLARFRDEIRFLTDHAGYSGFCL